MARRVTRIAFAATWAVAFVVVTAGVARAAFTASTVVSQAPITTLSLVAPASVTATTSDTCANVAVTWSAVSGATAYRIERSTVAGAWTAATTTGSVTTWTDTTGLSGTTVTYRVWARHASSGWESASAATSSALVCGIQNVTDLAVTNPCSSTVLTWSAPTGVTSYDIQRRVNGGAWTPLATDQATTGYTDATVHALDATVEYQVRPGTGTTANGNWTSSATIAAWKPFYVISVAIANSAAGTLGTLNAGDTVTVAFSKPVTTGTIASSIVTDSAGGNRGLYLGTTNSGTSVIGRLLPNTTNFGANAAYAGTVAWTNANTTWTWTSSVAGTTMSGSLGADTWTAGTGVKCAADGSSLVAAPAPNASGRW
jgi:hypothetical protein